MVRAFLLASPAVQNFYSSYTHELGQVKGKVMDTEISRGYAGVWQKATERRMLPNGNIIQ
jgi:hypothetical protein